MLRRYGWHNWSTAPLGTMLLCDGTIMAHDADIYITLTGKGGHGSAPAACIDPVPCGAAVVLALQTIVSRTLPSKTVRRTRVCQKISKFYSNTPPLHLRRTRWSA